MNRKRNHNKAVPLNLTFAPVIRNALDQLVADGGYKGPGEFFAECVRRAAGISPVDKVVVPNSNGNGEAHL